MKNEHLIWGYADMDGGGKVIILGLTDKGIEFLTSEKKTLLMNPPKGALRNVAQVMIYHEKDKATLKQRLREAGITTFDRETDGN